MQKADSQHKQAQSQLPAQQRKGAVSLELPQAEQLAQLQTMADNSPQVSGVSRLATMANNSPAAVAQRVALEGMTFSKVVQRIDGQDEGKGGGESILPLGRLRGQQIPTGGQGMMGVGNGPGGATGTRAFIPTQPLATTANGTGGGSILPSGRLRGQQMPTGGQGMMGAGNGLGGVAGTGKFVPTPPAPQTGQQTAGQIDISARSTGGNHEGAIVRSVERTPANRSQREDDSGTAGGGARNSSAEPSGHQQEVEQDLSGGLNRMERVRTALARFLPNADIPEGFERSRQQVLDDTLTKDHQEALMMVGNTYLFAIRETGAGSIKRLNEGAKAKPHTILEKSIKGSSAKAAYGAGEYQKVLQQVKALELDGFVGHWEMGARTNEKGETEIVPVKLLGVRVDRYEGFNPDVQRLMKDGAFGEYIPVDLNVAGGGDRLIRFKEAHPGDEWKKHLYTGDYDLHEVYDSRKHQIAEGADKARMVSVLNRLIAVNDPSRTGKAHVDAHHRTHVEGQYAMIQHGDQATYVANQHNEARGGGAAVASVVAGVSRQSEDPMVWQFNKTYYVTLNQVEHEAFRAAVGLVVSQEFANNDRSTARAAGKYRSEMDSKTNQHAVSQPGPWASGLLPPMGSRFIRKQADAGAQVEQSGTRQTEYQPGFLPKPPEQQ